MSKLTTFLCSTGEGAKQYCLGKKTKRPKVNVSFEPKCITLESDDDSERTQDQTQGIDGNFSQHFADNFDQTQEDQNTYVLPWVIKDLILLQMSKVTWYIPSKFVDWVKNLLHEKRFMMSFQNVEKLVKSCIVQQLV